MAQGFLRDPDIGLVLLDELNIALKYHYLDIGQVIADLDARPEMQHVVVTGRGALPELMAVKEYCSVVPGNAAVGAVSCRVSAGRPCTSVLALADNGP